MGSVLSAAHAALCSCVEAQLDKAEARRMMEGFPHLRDLPDDEREALLRRRIEEKKKDDNDLSPLQGWGEEKSKLWQDSPCRYMPAHMRRLKELARDAEDGAYVGHCDML